MDGVHDMGGSAGFGPVATDDGHLVSHEPWEFRAQMLALVSGLGTRAGIEAIEPATYLASGYYERWLRAAEAAAIARGVLTAEELDAWRRHFAGDPDAEMPTSSNPDVVEIIRSIQPHRHTETDAAHFAIGDRVRVRRMRPEAHHRCPRYVRGATGEIETVLGADPLPGAASGDGGPVPCYTVRFDAAELFGPDADGEHPPHALYIDLWETYLEEAR